MGKGEHRAGAVAVVVSVLYGVHSLFAWEGSKRFAQRLLGRRYSTGLYRFFYSVQSTICLVSGTLWFLRQPDRELYRVRWPWALGGRLVQLGGLLLLLDLARVVGPFRLLGVAQAWAALRGKAQPPTPVAQGPLLGEDGQVAERGMFRFIRHPDNLSFLLIMLGFPRMTYNRLAMLVVTVCYSVLGSIHEDRRLRRAYGAPFERYARRKPMLIPGLRPRRTPPAAPEAAADRAPVAS